MRELALVARVTRQTRVVELARKLRVHVETLVPLRAAVHQVELAQFELHRRYDFVRIRTLLALKKWQK